MIFGSIYVIFRYQTFSEDYKVKKKEQKDDLLKQQRGRSQITLMTIVFFIIKKIEIAVSLSNLNILRAFCVFII